MSEYYTGCAEHIFLAKEAAKEGIVLLKNEDNLLPLKRGTKLALFGKGTFDYVCTGGGSGSVNTTYVSNLYDGLKSLGRLVCIEENLAQYYQQYVQQAYETGIIPGMCVEPELPEELCQKARKFTDTAVITISRLSSESEDRIVAVQDRTAEIQGGLARMAEDTFENGDFYLSNAERAMVEQVKKVFPKVIVLLNVCGVVDTAWFAETSDIQAAMLLFAGGIEGGTAAAELLFGIGNPSGKLPDTFARHLTDYPSTPGYHESLDYVCYAEDIYVGYRYFETLPGAKEKVIYPFGFGLSYTQFEIKERSGEKAGDEFRIAVDITNCGEKAGKEVVQLYVCAPQGKLGKPTFSLVAFTKTRCLAPGETQSVTLSFSERSMASYDDLGKVKKSAWVLEGGHYSFYLGNSVRNTQKTEFAWTADEDMVVEQLSAKLVPTKLKHRLLSDGGYEELPMEEKKSVSCSLPCSGVKIIERKETPDFRQVIAGNVPLDVFVDALTEEELIHLLGGQPNEGVCNVGGIGNLPKYHIPNMLMTDGPAGVRICSEHNISTTAFPCANILAASWNPELIRRIGVAGAREAKENGLSIWLTPAVNIHRNPLCGRNFEYYSEDPLLAGVLGAAAVEGMQSQKVAPSLKHFAFNNKETNRKESDSRVSERAAREIYLRAFEIIVKTAKPWYIMSAYNKVNGQRASENRELLVDILRNEWGFDGLVSSDWETFGSHSKELKAQNDLKMPKGDRNDLKTGLMSGSITVEALKISAKRVLQLIMRLT